MSFKWCAVPYCENTSIKNPQKLFLSIPKTPKIRKLWLQLASRDPESISPKTNAFMCEDHFNNVVVGEQVATSEANGPPPSDYSTSYEPTVILTTAPMYPDKMCRICLTSSSKLLSLESYGLSGAYEQLTGVTLEHDDGLPRELCVECATLLDKYHKFRDKSIRGDRLIREMWFNCLTMDQYVQETEQQNSLPPRLGISGTCIVEMEPANTFNIISPKDAHAHVYMPITAQTNKENDTFIKQEQPYFSQDNDSSTDTCLSNPESIEIKEEVVVKEELEIEVEDIPMDDGTEDDGDEETEDPQTLRKDREDNLVRQHYKVTKNSFAEQQKHHKEKRLRESYGSSRFKCTLCYDGFDDSKSYREHSKLHSKERGEMVCMICKTRFTVMTSLRSHLEDTHLYKYHCLTCSIVLYNRSDALKHVGSHGGSHQWVERRATSGRGSDVPLTTEIFGRDVLRETC